MLGCYLIQKEREENDRFTASGDNLTVNKADFNGLEPSDDDGLPF